MTSTDQTFHCQTFVYHRSVACICSPAVGVEQQEVYITTCPSSPPLFFTLPFLRFTKETDDASDYEIEGKIEKLMGEMNE